MKRALIANACQLKTIFADQTLSANFVTISKTCEAVVCCRLNAGEKAQIIQMIKADDS
jgi:magnesium-transporting ATPase (P-type)